jgi:hypothetical protein
VAKLLSYLVIAIFFGYDALYKFFTANFFNDNVTLQVAWSHGVSLLQDFISFLVFLFTKGASEVSFYTVK